MTEQSEDAARAEPTTQPAGGFASLVRRIMAVAGSTGLAQAGTAVLYLLAARGLGPEYFGRYSTAIAVAVVAVVAFDFGLNNLIVREVAAGAMDPGVARAVVARKRRWAVLVEIGIVAVCWALLRDPVAALGIGSITWAQWEAQTGNALLRAAERFREPAVNQVVGRSVSLVPAVLLFVLHEPGLILSFGLVLGFVVEALLNRRSLGPAPPVAPGTPGLGHLHRTALGFALLGLASAAQQLDTPLVAWGGTATAAGIYAAAGRLIGPLGLLGAALTSVAAPWLARARDDPSALRREERRVALATGIVAVGPVLALLVGPWLLPILLGEAFRQSGLTFAVLAAGAFVSALNQGYAVVLQNRGGQMFVAVSVAIGLAFGLVATYFLAMAGGAVLAAVAYSVSQVVMLVLMAVRLAVLRRGRPR